MDAEEQDAHTHRSVSPVLRRLLLCILCTSKCQPLFPRDLTGDVRAVDLPLVLGVANRAGRLVALLAAPSLPHPGNGRSWGGGRHSACTRPSSGMGARVRVGEVGQARMGRRRSRPAGDGAMPDRCRSARRCFTIRWLGASRSPGHWCLDLSGDVRAVDLPLVLGMANLADRLVSLMAAPSLPNLRDGRSGVDSTCALPSSGRLGGGGAQGGALRCSTSSRLVSSR